MEFVLLSVGVVAVLVTAILVFLVSMKFMKEKSFEEVQQERNQRQKMIEEELGIKSKDVKKEIKKKKEKKVKVIQRKPEEVELREEESDDAEEVDSDDVEIPEKGKELKPQKVATTKDDSGRGPEKVDTKKGGKTPQSGSGIASGRSGESAKAKGKAKSEKEDFLASVEPEIPFTVAEGKNKKKKSSGKDVMETVATSKLEVGGKTKSSPKAVVAPKSSTAKVESVSKIVSTVQPPTYEAHAAEEWTKTQKGDTVALTKKQVNERIQEVEQLRSQLTTSNARYLDQHQELSTLRQNLASLQDRTRNELAEKVKEIESLKTRLSHSHVEHVKEMNQLNQLLQQASKGKGGGGGASSEKSSDLAGQMQLIKLLTDENKKLKEELNIAKSRPAPSAASSPSNENLQEKLKFLDDALRQNSVLLNSSENAKKTLEVKLKQSEEKLKKSEHQLKEVEKKLHTANDEFAKSEKRNKAASEELESAKKHVAEYQEKLQNAEKQRTDLEGKLSSLQVKCDNFEQLIKQKEKDSEAETGKQLAEEKRLKDEIQAELVRYKTTLAETEETLKKIQSGIEAEENAWKQKLTATENELQIAQEEVKTLRDQLRSKVSEQSKENDDDTDSNLNHVVDTTAET